jgi:uncharacterized protein DUF2188
MKKLIQIHVVSVNVVYGWLVGSNNGLWRVNGDTQYFPKKSTALEYAEEMALHYGGGSVRIHGRDGKIKEERSYPRARDPRRSKG